MENKRARKIYLLIISLITILAMVFGTVHHVGRYIGFGNSFFSNIFSTSSGKSVSETVTLDGPVSELYIDADVANISIKYGDDLSVYYCYPEDIKPNINLENEVLSIDFNGEPEINTESDNYKLTITIPNDCALSYAEITADVGNVKMSGIKTDKLSVEADLGNITLRDMDVNSLEADVELGNMTITDSTVKTSDLLVEMGNYEASGSFNEISCDVEMGNITIDSDIDADDMILDLDYSMGSCKVNGNTY